MRPGDPGRNRELERLLRGTHMAIWEYTLVVSEVGGTFRVDIGKVWQSKAVDGKSDWERVQRLGAEGWELVSAYPVARNGGGTGQVVWGFKRPKDAA